MKKTLAVLAVPALVLGVGMTAQAAPSRGSSATLNVSMNGALATGTARTAVFDGCGYAPGSDVAVKVVSATATSIMGVAAGSNGCISTADRSFPVSAGNYTASSWVPGAKRASASVSFNVAP